MPERNFDSLFGETEIFCSNSRAMEHIETDSISSIFMHHEGRIWIIAQTLRHFCPIGSQNDAVYYYIFEGWFLKQSVGKDMESIKPSARLIETLSNEICGKTLCEFVAI